MPKGKNSSDYSFSWVNFLKIVYYTLLSLSLSTSSIVFSKDSRSLRLLNSL
jgi:hypothetical protein